MGAIVVLAAVLAFLARPADPYPYLSRFHPTSRRVKNSLVMDFPVSAMVVRTAIMGKLRVHTSAGVRTSFQTGLPVVVKRGSTEMWQMRDGKNAWLTCISEDESNCRLIVEDGGTWITRALTALESRLGIGPHYTP